MTTIVEQIRAAYELDQKRNIEAVEASDLPLSYEAITDRWLTNVLCRNHPEARVIEHTLGEQDSGSSNRRRIKVQYNKAGQDAGLPTALFCKASHELSNRIVMGVAGAANAEVVFYNKIRPLLDIEAPGPIFANFDPKSFNSIILLEDLTDSVQSFCSHKTEVTRARAESQIRLMAKFHGRFHESPELKTVLTEFGTWPEFFRKTLDYGMKEGSNQGFLDAESVIPARLYKRFDEIWPATLASVEKHQQLPLTLMHGDVHLKNWYIAGNGEMGLSDWQCCTRGHWSRDLAYAIATALTVENRRAWEKDLVRLYLEKLAEAGGPVVTFDEAWVLYRQQLLSVLTWWTITLCPAPGMPDMQPRDITLEFIRRISIAMDDLDSLGVTA
ncbi:aminoglycoside phosphotransferase family protein [Noviherbaspirillum sedimenti]|uniref:Aminoglycoside phosphotransferase family protein n=1 Tax=Noviherbaspirillum sedimenti TaxID=2320865 RepID=A0A3A3G9A4_9BURK|nr:aminoglycoside phosphotransferase family protein [Noviherbaspirillum sedimenti]RJG03152.1 aminoglycoside phosphotransferase family protein [Noviherbaspirillum sedimenti]